MDPDANLKEQLKIAEWSLKKIDSDQGMGGTEAARELDRLCCLVQALNEWIELGGFLPASWGER